VTSATICASRAFGGCVRASAVATSGHTSTPRRSEVAARFMARTASRSDTRPVAGMPRESRSDRWTAPYVNVSSAAANPGAGLLFQLTITPP
jgi:hypothetical protein